MLIDTLRGAKQLRLLRGELRFGEQPLDIQRAQLLELRDHIFTLLLQVNASIDIPQACH